MSLIRLVRLQGLVLAFQTCFFLENIFLCLVHVLGQACAWQNKYPSISPKHAILRRISNIFISHVWCDVGYLSSLL